MVRIECWCLVTSDPYYPEDDKRIHGKVYGHPRHPDGKEVTTTPIQEGSGCFVTTRSGTNYQLGEPAPEYREWVKTALGRDIDPDNPIRWREQN